MCCQTGKHSEVNTVILLVNRYESYQRCTIILAHNTANDSFNKIIITSYEADNNNFQLSDIGQNPILKLFSKF